MDWLTKFWRKPEVQQETLVIDMMKDDVDPEQLMDFYATVKKVS